MFYDKIISSRLCRRVHFACSPQKGFLILLLESRRVCWFIYSTHNCDGASEKRIQKQEFINGSGMLKLMSRKWIIHKGSIQKGKSRIVNSESIEKNVTTSKSKKTKKIKTKVDTKH